MLEECHTTIEHLMDALLARGDKRGLSFARKLEAMVALGVFELTSRNEQLLGDQ
jgi:hypothetical protein